MSKRISEERRLAGEFAEAVGLTVRHRVRKTFADGRVEEYEVGNLVVGAGRDELALRATVTSHAPFGYLAAGSGTNAASLGSTGLTYETVRKAATMAASHEVIIGVCSLGGSADGVTSQYLDEAGLFNDASSGQGTMLNLLTGINHTFADSDVVEVHMEVAVGSYA